MTDRYDGWDLTNRPAMFPFLAEYTNRQTGEKSGGFAWPTMVTEPLRAANELLNTPSGTLPNPQNPEQQQNALTLLMSLYGGNALNPMARVPRNALAAGAVKAEANPQGFIAYHGSPHDFDKFDMSKIGTGEGAQAYGHGLYFAENEGVAKGYRDALSPDGLGVVARGRLRQHGGDIDKTIEYLRSRDRPGDEPFAINNRQALAELERAKAEGMKQGRMYQVRINANPEDFIDWDKPLSGQSESVRRAFESQGVKVGPQKMYEQLSSDEYSAALRERYGVSNITDLPREKWSEAQDLSSRPIISNYDPIGRDAFERLAGGDANYSGHVSPALREAGIPGIRYLDGNSRSAGEGSRNYVVFDDSIIDILKKYGIVPGMAAGANALSNYDPSITY